MGITIVNSGDLTTPYQCPVCFGVFYFDTDYIKHKCRGRKWEK